MNSNWNAYRMFFYVAYCGTTSAAANELHIAQPAVSHGIKQLEESFGCKLFNRSSHGMELTPIGQLLFENISGAVSDIENAEKLIEAEVKSSHAVITIGVSDTTLQHFLIPYIEEYKAKHPDVDINTRHGKNAEEIMKMFEESKIDFAVLHDGAEETEGFESIPVKEIKDVVFYASKFADRIKKDKLGPHDLSCYPVVTHEEGCVVRKNLDEYMEENGERLKPEYEFSLNSSIVQQVKRRFALGIVYHEVIADDVELGRLTEIDIDPPLPTRYFYLIKPQKIPRRAARSLVDFILDSRYSKFD